MSEVVGTKTYLISTQIGTVVTKRKLIKEYDVEDIIRTRAISQARAVQNINIGKQIDGNAQFPSETVPSIYRENDEALQEG